ncbi:DNA damage-repair/toleration protein DRT100-like [Brachypodium distachyon]|uniref:Leucine-rich repeat-containing N-terminal plant-type domain-containing protein n=1 Tax=Brachypodium distachyon TaxID=15368 RepID=I1I8F3_BRADI|nr:DNA damage-repair/toleration protein DRT100-like [Brachypodium distachyon]PNT68382.1 hypothetical protein BRADI_3g39895v3 [Brachypodium distachyon]|eukprot:XP_003572360.1 DNA damage-repair/toleration protein DRT100-like [Brachypodium distachyon]
MATPLLLPLATLLTLVVSAAAAACSESDRDALLSIRAALSDSNNLGVFSTWNHTTNCCSTYYGVSCDPATGRVTSLILRGEAPLDAVMALSGIPASGLMSGYISDRVCILTGLSTLVIADWKQISGPIPACLGAQSLPELRVLELPGNRLSGEIPPALGTLSRLAVLNLADNLLSGNIPSEITNLGSLKHLDLANNELTGSIPAEFGSLKMLSRALLSRNRLSGTIPSSVGLLTRLADLDLAENRLSGPIPDTLGTSGKKNGVLTSLYLGGNGGISGRIPAGLLRTKGLGIVNLSRNAVEGPIPDVFTKDSYFILLDLSRNRLTGGVPRSLSSAAYVGHLDLSRNRLCGEIPRGPPFDRLDAESFAGNSCLCGGPLGKCT